jgi:hypothetical protein
MSLRRSSSKRSSSSGRSASSGRPRIPPPPPPPPVRSYTQQKKKTPEPSFKLHTGPTIAYKNTYTISNNKPFFLFDMATDTVYDESELLKMDLKKIKAIEANNDFIRAKLKEMKSQQTRGGRRQRKTKRTRRHKRS